jgi:hypothetical protein
MPRLLAEQQIVVGRQVDGFDLHLRHPCRRCSFLDQSGHRRQTHAPLAIEQPTQRLIDQRLALSRCQEQNSQIFPVRSCFRRRRRQLVIGQAKSARRKQLGPVAIPGERAGLAHQPLDHMPIVDVVLGAATQTRLRFLLPLAVPHLDRIGIHTHFHNLADQSGRHRVDVPLDTDRAARLHAHLHDAERFQLPRRQRIQMLAFVHEWLGPRLVPLRAHFLQECHVSFWTVKVMAAAQQQRLLHRLLEAMVALFGVAVLVTLAGVDRLRLHAVVPHQCLVAAGELRTAGILHRQAHAVAAMHRRHAAQRPDRVLEAGAEALEAFREAKRDVLPV